MGPCETAQHAFSKKSSPHRSLRVPPRVCPFWLGLCGLYTMTMPSDAALRAIFDKFDLDRSGSVSTSEMAAMTRMLKMDLSPAALKQLMKEADGNGNGEIEFREFTGAIKRQLKSGGGRLASVVSVGADAGWFNPLAWFGGSEEEKEVAVASPVKTARPASSSKSSVRSARMASTERSREWSPTRRMWASQGLVQAANRESAAGVREMADAGQARKEALKRSFFERQQRAVVVAREQQEKRERSVELIKYQKRYEG